MKQAPGPDAFGLLGLPAQFDLDPQVIEAAFLRAHEGAASGSVRQCAGQNERVAALSRTRALNDAYATLKKPVSRAEYLLARAGITIGDNERMNPEFLMEVLELREELAVARAGKHSAEIERLQAAMTARRVSTLAELPPLFERDDLAGIKERVMLLRYVDRYLEECDAALDDDED